GGQQGEEQGGGAADLDDAAPAQPGGREEAGQCRGDRQVVRARGGARPGSRRDGSGGGGPLGRRAGAGSRHRVGSRHGGEAGRDGTAGGGVVVGKNRQPRPQAGRRLGPF